MAHFVSTRIQPLNLSKAKRQASHDCRKVIPAELRNLWTSDKYMKDNPQGSQPDITGWYLKHHQRITFHNDDAYKAITDLLTETDKEIREVFLEKVGRGLRKDGRPFVSFVVTFSPEGIQDISEKMLTEAVEKYFKEVEKEIGYRLLYCILHRDETTLHFQGMFRQDDVKTGMLIGSIWDKLRKKIREMNFLTLKRYQRKHPELDQGDLKKEIGLKQKIRKILKGQMMPEPDICGKLQDLVGQAFSHLGLERGIEGSRSKHVSHRKYWQDYRREEEAKKQAVAERKLSKLEESKITIDQKIEERIAEAQKKLSSLKQQIEKDKEEIERLKDIRKKNKRISDLSEQEKKKLSGEIRDYRRVKREAEREYQKISDEIAKIKQEYKKATALINTIDPEKFEKAHKINLLNKLLREIPDSESPAIVSMQKQLQKKHISSFSSKELRSILTDLQNEKAPINSISFGMNM